MADLVSIFNNAANILNDSQGFHAGKKENPEYNPKTKKGQTVPQFIPNVDSQAGETFIDKFINTYSSQGYTLDDFTGDKWGNIAINPVDSKEQLIRERAERQSAFTQLANGLIQTVGDRVFLGILRGFSDIADLPTALITGDEDYTNPVSGAIEQGQDWIRDNFEVYRKDPTKAIDFGDLGWYVNGATDIASTLSLMIPGIGASRAIQAVGKASKIGKLFGAAGDAITTSKMYNSGRLSKVLKSLTPSGTTMKNLGEGAKLMMDAGLMRVAENYQEAREAYKDIEDTSLQELNRMAEQSPEELDKLYETYPEFSNEDGSRKSLEEISKILAERGASDTFKDDMWLIALDALQLRGLGNLYKTFNRPATKGVETAERNLLNKFGANLPEPKGISKYIPSARTIGNYATELSEGFEEAFQYVNQNTATAKAIKKLNADAQIPTLSDYLVDDQMWNAAIWGAIGGMTFKGLGTPAVNYINKLLDRKDLDEQRRITEVQNRFELLNATLADIDKLNDNLAPATDEKGLLLVDQDDQLVYEKITPEQSIAKKEALIKNLATTLAINAANAGNYESMKSMFANPKVLEYIEGYDNFDKQSTSDFVNNLTSYMDNTFDKYLSEVKNATNAGVMESFAAQLIAEQNVRTMNEVEENDKLIQDYDVKINDEKTNIESKTTGKDREDIDNLFIELDTKFLPTYAKSVILKLDKDKAKIQQKRDSGEIGLLEYNRQIAAYDKAIKSIIKGLNIRDVEGNPVTDISQFNTYIEKNKLSDKDFVQAKKYDNLLNLYVDRANTYLTNYDLTSSLLKTDEDYRKAAKEVKNGVDKAILQTYNSAKTKLEEIYNKYNNSEEVNSLHYSLDPTFNQPLNPNIKKEDIEAAREAYKVMQETSDEHMAAVAADTIAKKVGEQKDAGIYTPNGHVTPEGAVKKVGPNNAEEPVVNQNNGTATASRTEKPANQQGQSSAQIVPEATNVQTSPSSEESKPQINIEPDKETSDKAESLSERVKENVSHTFAIGNYNTEEEVPNEDFFKQEVIKQLQSDGYTDIELNKYNDSINAILKGRLRFEKRAKFRPVQKSSVDIFEDLINYTKKERKNIIEEFLQKYSKDNSLFNYNGKAAISLENLLLRMYRELQKRGIGLTIDDAYEIYKDVDDYIKKSKRYINIKASKAIRPTSEGITKLDIQKLFDDSKKTELETDNRVDLINDKHDSYNYQQRSDEDIDLFNGALSKLTVGDKVYLKPRLEQLTGKLLGFEVWLGRPGRPNAVRVGFNNFNYMEDGGGFYFPSSMYGPNHGVWLTSNGIDSSLTPIIETILYGGFDSTKISNAITEYAKRNNITDIVKEVNDFRAILVGYYAMRENDDVDVIKLAEENLIMKYLVHEFNILNLYRPNDSSHLYGTEGKENVFSVLEKINNILDYDKNIELSNDRIITDTIFESYNNFLRRFYSNYNFTKTLSERAMALGKGSLNNKIIAVSVKSFNRANPLEDFTLKPLSEGLANPNTIKGCKIVVLDTFEGAAEDEKIYIAEDGSYKQKVNSTKIGTNVFKLLIPTGSKTPKFLDLVQNQVSKESEYGKAVRQAITDILINSPKRSYEETKKFVSDLFNYNGVVTGVNVAELTSNTTGKKYLAIRRSNLGENANPDLRIYENSGLVGGSDTAVLDEQGIKNVLAKIFDDENTLYAFPGDIVFEKTTEENTFIKKQNGKIVVNIGDYNKTFDSFAEFIYDSNIAYSYLYKKEFKYKDAKGEIHDVNSNFEYYYVQDDVRQRPRLTVDNDYSISILEEGKEVFASKNSQTLEDRNEITEFVNNLENEISKKNKNRRKNIIHKSDPINITDLINVVAKNYTEELNSTDYKFIKDILPENVIYDNSERSDVAYYSNGKVYITKLFFDDNYARNSRVGQREALRELFHESIHKAIDENEEISVANFNDTINEIKKSVDNALNNPDSREYKEFDTIDWEGNTAERMRNHFRGLINGIEERYKDSANKELNINEEWIVESITRNSFQKLLNNISTDEKVEVEKPKTLLQKIFDLIRKLFNFGSIKNNTLLAKEYNAFTKIVSAEEEIITEPVIEQNNSNASPVEEQSTTEETIETTAEETPIGNIDEMEIGEEDDIANADDEYDDLNSINITESDLEAPSPNELSRSLTSSEYASLRSQIERGTFKISCK